MGSCTAGQLHQLNSILTHLPAVVQQPAAQVGNLPSPTVFQCLHFSSARVWSKPHSDVQKSPFERGANLAALVLLVLSLPQSNQCFEPSSGSKQSLRTIHTGFYFSGMMSTHHFNVPQKKKKKRDATWEREVDRGSVKHNKKNHLVWGSIEINS